ncbi:hypothetical protein [Enterobacter asburiae]|uniref:hypothetical protein n=1 Tax=Enterobacter asburiae TaxID=61645 RepID=UPI0012D33706|nr:hypothetical protein [Enterobacter asburiae]
MADLYDVAEHLSKQAKSNYKRGDSAYALADAFGRSAFNRYYYASFLNVRDLVSTLDGRWARISHKGIPDLLRGAVTNMLTEELKKSVKKKFITESQSQSKKSAVITSLDKIASIMSEAYDVRGLVDYQPEIKILFEGDLFEVNSISVTKAKGWTQSIKYEKAKVITISKEIGLV